MVIYLDGVMGLNFLVDWLLLLGVNRLSGFPPGMGRTAAAAAMGGGYAGMCLLPGFSFLTSGLWRGVSLGIMSMTAFGLDRTALRRGVLFVLLSLALGGMALAFCSGTMSELIGAAAGIAVLCRIGFPGIAGARQYHKVQITYSNRTVELNALADTGNTLRDPVTGQSVLVVDCIIAKELLGLAPELLSDPASAMASVRLPGFRLIPCKTVGQTGGMLLAIRCDEVQINGKQAGTLVAFSPVEIGDGTYHGLTGG